MDTKLEIKNLISAKNNDDVIRNNLIISKRFPEIVLDNDIRKRIFYFLKIAQLVFQTSKEQTY